MPSITRAFATTASPEAAFDYLADFRNAEGWDPGTKTCQRTSGDGGVGTTYRNVSGFLGREVELTYTTAQLEPERLVLLTGRNDSFDGEDRFEIERSGDATRITYHAEMHFSGASKLASPLVAAYLPLLAKKTVDQLRDCLDRLSA
ncbi:Polyketide cyclase / dehydrase and lipid transport [Nocardioides exalbidus]|uniref:Polyketide cyclase / dehydrase and lipid transport n=1 Tax=Nocardioides exalbidus TaxID=402596 RepID=A0A1H4MYC5_9ACTN|nr:SRPBCC family protein [Nocardioides exalbidus]SEB88071.1 Polyketide cyclase / dehydrase and lipid transport [Nocardioides exalbidus]